MRLLAELRKRRGVVNTCRFIVIAFSVACAGIIIYKQAFPASRALDANARDFFNRYIPSTSQNASTDNALISHRMTLLDASRGLITPEETRQALMNINAYLGQVKIQCSSDIPAPEWMKCASSVLHDNFYYRAADEVGRGYAGHNSDCDANVFLIMDAASRRGLETYIVYAPGHAFIAWKNELGKFSYHETTGSNNAGRPFDFRNQLYKKTYDHTYYVPRSAGDPVVEATYRAITARMSGYKDDLAALFARYPDNALINNAWYRLKRSRHDITNSDATLIQALQVVDLTDSGKFLSLVDYYLGTGDTKLARKAFDRVPARDCDAECYNYGVALGIDKFRLMQPVWESYDRYTKSHGVAANTWTFWGIWPKTGLLLTALAFIIWAVLTGNRPDAPRREITGWRKWLRF